MKVKPSTIIILLVLKTLLNNEQGPSLDGSEKSANESSGNNLPTFGIPNTTSTSATPSASVDRYSNEGLTYLSVETNGTGDPNSTNYQYMDDPAVYTIPEAGFRRVPLNPHQYATLETAQNLAARLGGTVVNTTTSALVAAGTEVPPMYGILVPGAPDILNAGLVARSFEIHGEDPNGWAWRSINTDLGRT